MATIRIGLLWHSANSGNLGVGALTVGNMRIAREVAQAAGLTPEFTIFCLRDRGPSYIDGAAVYWLDARTMLDPRGYATAVAGMDCVLDIGAGDSFTDIYPLRRYKWIVLGKVIALLRGRPLLFSPQTIGPFAGETAAKRALNRLARWTMRRARAVVVRDMKSADAVRAEVPGIEPVYAVDVAFALPWDPAPPRTGPLRIGLNVSGLLWNGGHTGRHEFGLGYDYKALTSALIDALLARGDSTIELICHVNDFGSNEDDGRVADEIAARWPMLVRVPDFASPSAAKSHIARLDFLVGARMHACIAAFGSGVAVVPVSYSRKFEGLFGSLGYERLVPFTGMGTAAALASILDAFDHRADLKAEVDAGLVHVAARLDAYRMILDRLFHEVSRVRS